MTGAGGALLDWGAAGEGDGWGGQETVDVGGGLALAGAGDGAEVQAGAGAGEGGAVRALGPGREAGLRASEAWGEPLSVEADEWRPGPGMGRWSGSEEGTGVGGLEVVGAAVAGGGLGEVRVDWGCWLQGVGGPCSSPGSSPGCALGLTPCGGRGHEAPGCHWWRAHGCQNLEL